MYLLPDEKKFQAQVLKVLNDCRISCQTRANHARQWKTWRETGSPDGGQAIFNRLKYHIGRMQGFLYSPSGLRFAVEYENRYEESVYAQSEAAAVALTKRFVRPRRGEDMTSGMLFADGVYEALTYGAAVVKTLQERWGPTQRLVMPWQMGVYREDLRGFEQQEAISETNYITPFDLWRRISHQLGAVEKYKRARAYAKRTTNAPEGGGYFHQVVLGGTSPAVLTDQPYVAQAGGFVTGAAPTMLSPEVAEDLIELHELWIRDDVTGDWTTVQIVEPDIVITSKLRRQNLFLPNRLPYTLIQPNGMTHNFWGASELEQLVKLQWLLRDRAEDMKKLMSLQYDRLLAFTGQSGMTDDTYDRQKQAGWFQLDPGSDVKDLTPQMPENSWQEFDWYFKLFDEIAGFKPIMAGEGDAGVRSGNQAQTLLRTASPQMRDKALVTELQCGMAGHNFFECLAQKQARTYWTKAGVPQTDFYLNQLPEDRVVTVDSHSSSPIYEDEHMQLAAFALKGGVIDGESFIDMVNGFPQPELMKEKLAQREAAKAAQIKQLSMTDPQGAMKLIQGGKR